jgi:hypothetical protein
MWKNMIYLLLLLVLFILVFRWNGKELIKFSILEGATGSSKNDDTTNNKGKDVVVKSTRTITLPKIV